MRSTFVAAAFVAGALAVPMEKRQVTVTNVDIAYVTNIVTVTQGAEPVATTAAEYIASSAPVFSWPHWGHHKHTSSSSSVEVPATTPSPYSVEAPATTEAPVSTQEALATAWTSYWTSYFTEGSSAAPAPSSEAPAPSSVAAPAPAPATSEAASPTSVAAAATATTYQQAVVNHHNYHRANHSSPDVTWNNTLASIASSIAATCTYAHNTEMGGGGYGQNIAAGASTQEISSVITSQFYNNEVSNFTANNLYGQAQPDMTDFESWGHFTQIVWKGTTSVGCYTMDCTGGLAGTGSGGGYTIEPYFTVCNYYPPGNYDNEYADNVGDSLNKATVDGDYNVNTADISDPSV